MEQKYQYLFLFEGGKIKTYSFDTDKNEFELLKYKGEESYPYTNNTDFWSWWEGSVSYNSKHSVDLCYITDENHNITNESYKRTRTSVWNMDIVKKFFESKTNYTNITCRLLCGGPKTEEKFQCPNKEYKHKEPKEFYVAFNMNKNLEKAEKSDKEGSALYIHFKDKRKKEQDNK